MSFIFVRKVRKEDAVLIPEKSRDLLPCGELVKSSSYWRERISSGIVEELPLNGPAAPDIVRKLEEELKDDSYKPRKYKPTKGDS